jgi:N-formylglutamate amidohydrolase
MPDTSMSHARAPETGKPSPASHPFEVAPPAAPGIAVVVASPHSGRDYPPGFLAQSRLPPRRLRRSEDSFVDDLFAAAPELGAPLIRARFPRIYVDANREPFELDPRMFEEAMPDYVNAASPRVAAGLGTIARVAACGEDIYREKLPFAEALARIERCYRPYHLMLRSLVDGTAARFGHCILLDCHSMPSVGHAVESDAGRKRADFVLGDCFGESCGPAVTARAEDILTEMGFTVRRNVPYSGGYTTRHYGRPPAHIHALQIEVNRALYMDQDNFVPKPELPALATRMRAFVAAMGALDAAL